jgi:Polyketide cyclase / dehydrase and lipid transport
MQMKIPVTTAITIEAPPEAVLGVIGDPRTIPVWAPAFGRAVRCDEAGGWHVDGGEGEFPVRVRLSEELGTVDFLAPHEDRGAFLRVVPNGQGSELLFTVFVAEEAAAARQRAILEDELKAVQALSERRAPGRG